MEVPRLESLIWKAVNQSDRMKDCRSCNIKVSTPYNTTRCFFGIKRRANIAWINWDVRDRHKLENPSRKRNREEEPKRKSKIGRKEIKTERYQEVWREDGGIRRQRGMKREPRECKASIKRQYMSSPGSSKGQKTRSCWEWEVRDHV